MSEIDSVEIGKAVHWMSRVWRVVGWWSDDQAIIRDVGSDTTTAVRKHELTIVNESQPLKIAGPLDDISRERWDQALATYEAVKALAENPARTKQDVDLVAARFNVHRSTVYEWLRLYETKECAEAFLRSNPGPKPGSRKLLKEVEDVIAHLIEKRWLKRPGISDADLVEVVRRVCRRLHYGPPSKKAVLARLKPFRNQIGARARRGQKAAADETAARPGANDVQLPLDQVQLDHTLVDIILLTGDEYRYVVGRPWLTLAMDVCTRLILGYYLAYEHPTGYSVGLATAHACFDKAPLLKAMGINDVSWQAQGKMKTILLDRAAEHKTLSYVRACSNRGIQVVYREMPHWGGHIERLIGTAMRTFHALPGTTRSNIQDRGDYDSEGQATMTFEEANRYLVYKFCAYNHTIHSALDESPWAKWHRLLSSGNPVTYRPPAPISDPRKFLLELMPHTRRTVRRDGIHVVPTRYWSPELASWLHNHERVNVHWDPRDMSAVYVPIPGRDDPLVVPYADLRLPRLSLSEWRARKREQRARGRDPRQQVLVDQYQDAADGVVDGANAATRKAKVKRREATKTTTSTVDAWHGAYGRPGAASLPAKDAPSTAPLMDVENIPDASVRTKGVSHG